MYETESILDVARAIRPFLTDLLGAEGNAADLELARYLDEATKGKNVHNLILDFVRRDERTRLWTRDFFASKSSASLKSYSRLAGDSAPVHLSKYRCPANDYIWYRRDEAQEVPRCPTHDLVLEEME